MKCEIESGILSEELNWLFSYKVWNQNISFLYQNTLQLRADDFGKYH